MEHGLSVEPITQDTTAQSECAGGDPKPELARLSEQTSVVHAVNQVEGHPYFSQHAVQQANREQGIPTQAWSPKGGITSYRGDSSR